VTPSVIAVRARVQDQQVARPAALRETPSKIISHGYKMRWLENLKGKIHFGRPKHKWESNIKMGLKMEDGRVSVSQTVQRRMIG
jgi:hypothetical protein